MKAPGAGNGGGVANGDGDVAAQLFSGANHSATVKIKLMTAMAMIAPAIPILRFIRVFGITAGVPF